MKALFLLLKGTPPAVVTVNPLQLFDNTWLPIILGLVQVASLVFLVIYVVKTVEIARANRQASEAAQRATEATLASVKLSEQTLNEMQAARDAETAPYVILYLDGSTGIVFLIMENTGRSVAKDISLDFQPPLHNSLMGKLPAFVTGVTPVLAPGQRMTLVLNSYAALVNDPNWPSTYKATVNYLGGVMNITRSDSFVLDVNSFEGMTIEPQDNYDKLGSKFDDMTKAMTQVAKHLEAIEDRLDVSLRSMSSPLSFDVQMNKSELFSTCIRLLESLRMNWQLLGEKASERAFIAAFEVGLAEEAIERVTRLLWSADIAGKSGEQLRGLAFKLLEDARSSFRFYRFNNSDVPSTLEELLSMLRLLETSFGEADTEVELTPGTANKLDEVDDSLTAE